MPEIQLDITCENEIIICFENKIPLNLIYIVQIFIHISTTNFYVIDILILFFVYLKLIFILVF